jgi:mono/diheme cytochrome c family protein
VVTAILAVVSAAALGLSAYIGLQVVVTVGLLAMVGAGAILLWWLWTRRRAVEDRPVGTAAGGSAMVAVAMSAVATFVVIQLVPYGRSHSNPPVTGEPQWANERTRELMVDACFACHSNEVDYPWYASVAPISWEVQHHVDEGREKVNYSEFVTDSGEADESVEVVEEGEMPPSYFTHLGLHPEADLTPAEIADLIDGLRKTPGLAGG